MCPYSELFSPKTVKYGPTDQNTDTFHAVLFIDDVILVDMIVAYTKFYVHRENVETSFQITNETFAYF